MCCTCRKLPGLWTLHLQLHALLWLLHGLWHLLPEGVCLARQLRLQGLCWGPHLWLPHALHQNLRLVTTQAELGLLRVLPGRLHVPYLCLHLLLLLLFLLHALLALLAELLRGLS